MITTTQAISSLRPNTEWTLNGDDVENIIWHTKNVQPLTRVEIDAEVERLTGQETVKKAEAVAAKETAQAKLAALGLTIDDLKALGL